MKKIPFGSTGEQVSAVALGCMRLTALSPKQAAGHLSAALELGVNFVDHADIYGAGQCETLFAQAVKDAGISRDRLWIQSKCGIVSGVCYNFDKQHILNAAEGILKRLEVDYLDSLLLHRPDTLMEPEEVAEAFDILHSQGKVRYFGVSNHTAGQMKLMSKHLNQKLQANQLQFGLGHPSLVRSGMECNMLTEGAAVRDGEVLTYCRCEDITIQTWSPFQYGMFQGHFFGSEKHKELNDTLEALSAEYGVSPTTLASAWILRHPAKMQLIAGTMNPQRLAEIAAASEVTVSREHWYRLYMAAGNSLP